MADDEGNRRGTWSILPDLLLWMIKDKLDIFDNTRLAAVCRDWRSASASYPKRLQSVGDGLPWIFDSVGNDYHSTRRQIISVTRKQKFIIDLPEFQDAFSLFSKHGWILLRRQNLLKSIKQSPDSFFMVNIFTRAKIKLPDMVDTPCLCGGSFSTTQEGYPHCIVLLYKIRASRVTVRIAYLGENEVSWIDHTYFDQPKCYMAHSNLIIIGQRVYCYDDWGRMIIYDMAGNSWKQIIGLEDAPYQSYIAELDGEIMKIEPEDFNFKSFKVFRYNDAASAWEQLSNDAVRDTSWYLAERYSCFAAKEKGLKVYFLCPEYDHLRIGQLRPDNFVVHDLLTGSMQTLHLPYPITIFAAWVDIG